MIDALVTKSLIAPSGTRALRYRLLDTTRTYAFEKLREAGEARRAAQRHAEYFREVFDRAEVDGSIPLPDWLGSYGAELGNIRAALDWAFAPDGDVPLGIVYATDAKIEPGVKVVGVFPDNPNDPIVYPVAATANAKAGTTQYLAFLRSTEATSIFEGYGFSVLAKPTS